MTCSRLTAFVLFALTSSALAGGAGGPPAAAPSSAGCVAGFVQPAPSALGRALASAQTRWKAAGLRTYSFDFEQIAQPVRYPKTHVTVSAGQVSARPVEEGDASAFAEKASVEELFGFIRQGIAFARTSPCTELKVTYAPDGHPLSFASQLQTPSTVNGRADGGASWTVSDFRKR